MSGQIFMIGGRHISAGIDVIGQMVSQFFWRIADLGTERALDLSEHTILALALFAWAWSAAFAPPSVRSRSAKHPPSAVCSSSYVQSQPGG